MGSKILFFDSSNTRENTLKLLESFNYNVIQASSEEDVVEKLKSNSDIKLLISEIAEDNVSLSQYLFSIRDLVLKNKIAHMAVTASTNIFDISMAEASNVRPILFKPVQPEILKSSVHFSILNLRNGFILCNEVRRLELEQSFSAMGFDVSIILSKVEFNRKLYEKKVDFIVYMGGVKDLSGLELTKRMMKFKGKVIPLCFFNEREDKILTYHLEQYGPHKILLPPHNIEIVEDVLKQLILDSASFDRSEIKPVQQKIEKEKKEKDQQLVVPQDQLLTEKNTGTLNVIEFLTHLDKQFPNSRERLPFTYYFKKGGSFQKSKCLDIFNETKNKKIHPFFFQAYESGNNSLRSSLVDLYMDMKADNIFMTFLLRALKDPVEDIRYDALLGLKSYSAKKIVNYVHNYLVDSSLRVRQLSATILQEVKDITILDDFIKSLLIFEDKIIINSLLVFLKINYGAIKDLTIFNKIFISENSFLIETLLDFFISKKDKRILPILRYLIKSNDYFVSKIAIMGLGDLKDLGAIESLLTVLPTKNGEFAEKTILTIMQKYNSAKYLEIFKSIVTKGHDRLREEIVEIVKNFKESDKLEVLKIIFTVGKVPTKIAVVDAFEDIKPKIAILIIGPSLDSSDKFLSEYIMKFIKRSSDSSCLESLVQLFKYVKQDRSKEIIAETLSQIVEKGNDNALFKLTNLDAYSHLTKILSEHNVSLGKYTSEVLGDRVSDEGSFELVLKSLYDSNVESRAEAAFLLGEKRNVAATAHLLKFIDDQNWYVRRMIIEALGKIGSKEACPNIISHLDDENVAVRTIAAETLVKFKVQIKDVIFGYIVIEDQLKILYNLLKLIAPFKSRKETEDYMLSLDSLKVSTRVSCAAKLLLKRESIDNKIITSWFISSYFQQRLLAIMYIAVKNSPLIYKRFDMLMKDESIDIKHFLLHFLGEKINNPLQYYKLLKKYYQDASDEFKLKLLEELKIFCKDKILSFVSHYFLTETDNDVVIMMVDLLSEVDDVKVIDILLNRREYPSHIEPRLNEIVDKLRNKG